jgi:hypothetical protein
MAIISLNDNFPRNSDFEITLKGKEIIACRFRVCVSLINKIYRDEKEGL